MSYEPPAINEPPHSIVGDAVNPYFVTVDQFGQPKNFPGISNRWPFLNMTRGSIKRNNEIGWEKPDNTDPNSSIGKDITFTLMCGRSPTWSVKE